MAEAEQVVTGYRAAPELAQRAAGRDHGPARKASVSKASAQQDRAGLECVYEPPEGSVVAVRPGWPVECVLGLAGVTSRSGYVQYDSRADSVRRT